MAELKTKPTDEDARAYIDSIEPPQKRSDCHTLCDLFEKATGDKAVMWGPGIIGFGNYHYVYESGREGDWFKAGFAPRKANISLYLTFDMSEIAYLLPRLGKHKTGRGCVYINKLGDIDLNVLEKILVRCLARLKL